MVRIILTLACVCSLTGCIIAPAVMGTDHSVKILFDADNCPTAADPAMLDTVLADSVQWQSYDSTGTTVTQEDYEIFFDPFQGQPIKSNAQTGRTQRRNFANGIPDRVTYKYSVVGNDCATGAAPLDPHIRILN